MIPPNFTSYFLASQGAELPGVPAAVKGYRTVEAANYHAWPALNASLLKEPSACHLLHHLCEPETDHFAAPSRAEAFTVGTLVHWACLEPDKIKNYPLHMVLCETDGLGTKAAQRQRLANPGKLLVTAQHIEQAQALRRAVWMQSEAAQLLKRPGVNELSGFSFHAGIWRKWRPDRVLLDGTRMIDVKTTRVELVGKRGIMDWERECWKMGYFLQAAWYLFHHELATGVRPNAFTFVAVCSGEPHHARCFTLENFPSDHPLYTGSALQKARQLLGLEEGADVDRVAVFTDAARQTIAAVQSGQELTPELLRTLWAAEEHETSGPAIGLPKAA